MLPWRKGFIGGFLVAACLALSAGPVSAHPHVWIDLRSTLLFNDRGEITGLDIHWAFDEFYSLYVVERIDPDGDGKGDRKALVDLAAQSIKELKDYRYFTFASSDGKAVPYGTVETFDADIKDGRFIMTFTLPFAEPVDPRESAFTYAAYDPSYYIEIVHAEGGGVEFAGTGATGCASRVEEPDPSIEQVSLAAALDRNQTAASGFGAFFAETVHVTCG